MMGVAKVSGLDLSDSRSGRGADLSKPACKGVK